MISLSSMSPILVHDKAQSPLPARFLPMIEWCSAGSKFDRSLDRRTAPYIFCKQLMPPKDR
jgi:hypothetical protein